MFGFIFVVFLFGFAAACQPTSLARAFLSNPRPTDNTAHVAMDLSSSIQGRQEDLRQATAIIDVPGKQIMATSGKEQVLNRTANYVAFSGAVNVTGNNVQVTAGGQVSNVHITGNYIVAFAIAQLNRTYVLAKYRNALVMYVELLGNPQPSGVLFPLSIPVAVDVKTEPSKVLISTSQQVVILPVTSSVPCVDSIWLYLWETTPGEIATSEVTYLGYDGFAQQGKWVGQYIDSLGTYRGITIQQLGSSQVDTITFTQDDIDAAAWQFGLMDLCTPNPCLNDGICKQAKGFRNFTCLCSAAFSGLLCNVTVPNSDSPSPSFSPLFSPSPPPEINRTNSSSPSPQNATAQASPGPTGNGTIISNINVQVIVGLQAGEFTWTQFAQTVGDAMGLPPTALVPLSTLPANNTQHTTVKFSIAEADNVKVMHKQQQLAAQILGGNPMLMKDLPLLASRLIAEDFREIKPGFPAWLIVGIVIMIILCLICIKCEW